MKTSFWAAAAMTAATAACAMGRRPPKKHDAPPAAASPTTAAPTEKTPMTIQEWKGQNGGPSEPGRIVCSDTGAWERAWKQVGKDAPPLDFDRFVGVLVFVGEKPTGGWTAFFEEPVVKGDDLVVRYRVPKPGGFTTQAFTQSWKARAFPRPKGRVIVEAASE
jgi:hypothetical protein